jgi:hypothetical protein
MLTVIETPLFASLCPDYWTEDERGAFAAWLAQNPSAGNVIPQSGGVRKVRWSREGMGKRGGVRVIYYNQLANGEIWLLLIYAKNEYDTIAASTLKKIKEALEHDD